MADSEPLSTIPVEFENARELADLISIKRDLEFVAECAERLAELHAQGGDPDPVVVQALQTAALIAYVRCFSTGKRFGLTEETLVRGPEGARDYHRYLKDLRDKHVAHSVNPFEQTLIGVVLSADESAVAGVAQLQLHHISFDKSDRSVARLARADSGTVTASHRARRVVRRSPGMVRPSGPGFGAVDRLR